MLSNTIQEYQIKFGEEFWGERIMTLQRVNAYFLVIPNHHYESYSLSFL